MGETFLAIDIGGSKIIAGLTDAAGTLLCHKQLALPRKYDAPFLLEQIVSAARDFLPQSPAAAGVTIPGLADPGRGVWLYAPFSSISDWNIAALLAEKLGLPVYIDNDVNACAMAEKRFGICKDSDHFLWVTVSNGIGGALYLNGRLYRGARGNAGEIGHFVVEENTDSLCGCGRKGCLEAMASGTGISNEYFRKTGIRRSAKEIAALAKEGTPEARQVYFDAGYYIGKAVSYAVNLLNLDRIVLGGGVALDFELLQEGLKTAFGRYVFRQANPDVSVARTGLGYYAALSGCAAIVLDQRKEG